MTQTETMPPQAGGPPPAPMRRSMRYVLIASLAVNLLVLGLVAGAVIRGPDGFRAPRGVDLALGPIVAALAPEDRDAIRAELRQREALQLRPRRDRDALIAALLLALRAEPFDPAATQAALNVPRDRALAVQQAVQQSLLARITAMTPAGRLAFADRLSDAMGHGGRDGDQEGDQDGDQDGGGNRGDDTPGD